MERTESQLLDIATRMVNREDAAEIGRCLVAISVQVYYCRRVLWLIAGLLALIAFRVWFPPFR